MADKRIIEHTATTTLYNDDYFLVDRATTGNDGGTRKIVNTRLKQLFGGNNFAGEWHSGTVYNKEAYVTHEGKLYHNIKGGSVVAVDWSSSQWEQVSIGNELRKIVESLAPTFDTSTNYKVDDLVIYDNTLYRCIVAHTAGTWIGSHFGTVKVSSLLLYSIMDNFTDIYWEDYSGSPVNYTKGTVIHKGLKLYRCKADTTNQSWVSSKWEQVDVTDLLATEHGYMQSLISSIAPTFSSSAQYGINDFVIYNNQLYICMKPHHGNWYSPDFSPAKIGEVLEGIFHDIADVYNPSNSYVKGDVVNYLGIPLKCIVDTATSPMVFSEWEQVTVAQLIDEKVADVQIAGQTTVDENKISDLTSLAIEGTASGEIASFSDGSNLPMRSFVCNIDAVQDLHGQDAPWVGGAGKNKLPLILADIKALNTNGTWSGNTYTYNNIDYTIITDTDNNIIGIKVTGTASANSALNLCVVDTSSDMILNGCPANGSSSTYRLATNVINKSDYGNGVTLISGSNVTPYIIINTDYTCPTAGLMFYPMIRLATETDPTFAPYENICPISGHTGVDAWVRGKNLIDIPNRIISTSLGISTIGCESCTATKNGEVITATITGPWSKLSIQVRNGIQLKNGETYTFSATFDNPNGNRIGLAHRYLKGSWNALTSIVTDTHIRLSGSFTYDSSINDYVICSCLINNTNASTNNTVTVKDIMLEKGSTISDWNAYNPNSQTISVSWQTEAGEAYGGYVDLVSGELTATHKSQTGFTRGSQDSSNKLYNIGTISDIKTFNDASNISTYFVDSMFEKMSIAGARTAGTPSIAHYSKALYVGGYIGKETELDTLLETLQVVYELKTPITYQLTPTQIKSLLGNNNAWCSTGDVNVKYNKDATIAYENTGDSSSVIANPSGTATDTLQKVDIDGVIYDIQGGGGGTIIYSTTERKVGKWNNDDLYQKSYFYAVSSIDLTRTLDNSFSTYTPRTFEIGLYNEGDKLAAHILTQSIYVYNYRGELWIEGTLQSISRFNYAVVTVNYTK